VGIDNGLRKTLLAGETELSVLRLPPGPYAVVASSTDATTAPVLVDAPGDILVRVGGGSPVTGTLAAPAGADSVFPCGIEFLDAKTGVRVGRWHVNHRGEIRGPSLGRGTYRGRLTVSRSAVAFPLARVFAADGETPVDASTVLQAGGQLRVTIRWEDATPPRFLAIRHHGDVIRRVEVSGAALAGKEPVVVPALAPGEYELVLGERRSRCVVDSGSTTTRELD
jgi:hypothetical protein